MPLLYYTWRQAKKAALLARVLIATDSEKIRTAAIAFGAEVVMTSVSCRTGTDRVAEAARAFRDFVPDIVVNIQGDEPLVLPAAIDACADALLRDKGIPMSTVAAPLSSRDRFQRALRAFSRQPPHPRCAAPAFGVPTFFPKGRSGVRARVGAHDRGSRQEAGDAMGGPGDTPALPERSEPRLQRYLRHIPQDRRL